MASRRVPLWLLVVLLPLTFAAGTATSIGVRMYAHFAGAHRRWRMREYNREMLRRVQQVPDSIRRALEAGRPQREAEFLQRMRTRPLEIARTQASSHCVVSYLVRDTARLGPEWMAYARAYDPPAPRRPFERYVPEPQPPLAEAWVYRPQGWSVGDTMTIVLPNVICDEELRVSLGGMRAWFGPAPPITVEQR